MSAMDAAADAHHRVGLAKSPSAHPPTTDGAEYDADIDRTRPVDTGPFVIRVVRAIVVVLLVFFFGAVYIPLFFMGSAGGTSDYAHADVVYLKLLSYQHFFYPLFLGSTALLIFLTLFDVGFWPGPLFYVGRVLVGVMLLGYVLLALVCTAYFPAADIVVYLCLVPLVMFLVKTTCLSGMTNQTFVFWSGFSLFVVATAAGLGWAVWVGRYDNYWEASLMRDYFIRLNCTTASALPNDAALLRVAVNVIESSGDCNEAFLYWLSPAVLSIWCLFMSFVLFMVYRAQNAFYENKKRFDPVMQGFAFFVALCLLGMWVAAGIAGAEASVATDVFAFSMLGLVIAVGALIAVSGIENFKEDVKQFPIIQRVLQSTTSDWMRSLLFFLFAPLTVVVLPLSFLRQMGRRCLPFTKTLDDEERKLWLTLETSNLLAAMRHWHWTSILTKAIYWGLAFDIVHVGISVLLNVLFSWMNDELAASGLSFAAICCIYTAVGFLLLQFPPTPGMPLFIASAIIVVSAGMTQYGADYFWPAWAWSSFVSLLIKETGMLGAQVTGHLFGLSSVSIRRMVGINSMELRSIRFILMQKGLTIAKIAVLLGGPDWPVAAIAGILRTSYISNMIGTAFVIILIVPLTLSGAFLLRTSEGGLWASATSMMLAVAILFQGLSMVVAMHYIDRTIENHRAELEAYPTDEAVAKLDEEAKENVEARKHASQWRFLPCWLQATLFGGFVLTAASAYAFALFNSKAFAQFAIQDHIADLPGGKVSGIVKPLGWVGIGFALYGLLAVILLGRWVSWFGVRFHKVQRNAEGTPIVEPVDAEAGATGAEKVYAARWERLCCGA